MMSSSSSNNNNNNLFVDVSNEAPLYGQQRKRTGIISSIFYCLLLSGYAAFAVGAPWIFRSKQHLIPHLLCTSDVVLFTLTGIFQQYMVYQVKKIRLQGYYIFSQKLKHVIRLPFATISYGTAAMLLFMVWEPHINNLPIAMLLSYYDGGRLSDQQVALLQYQQENLNFLSEEIMRLQECLSKYERSSDNMTPQVDLAHLLAARDQELRTLSAEMNQQQSELRLP